MSRGMEIELARCGGSEGKVIQGSCAPMAGRCGGRFSEHSEHSEWLADACLWLGGALCKQRGAYGCHLPARGGPPTFAGLLLAWWSVGGAVGRRGRFAARCALL